MDVAASPQAAPLPAGRPRVVLICHADDRLNREGLARWLASVVDLVGVVELHETSRRQWRRVRREVRRVGWLRFLDVLAFRVYARFAQRAADARWEGETLARIAETCPPLAESLPVLRTSSPNTAEARDFLRRLSPDLMLARCKTLLGEATFSIPTRGTFVLHPGICPRYRNAHGGFWALAQDDLANVGVTLLKIDRGIDTGPIYGYFRPTFDPLADSHQVIQHRGVFDQLPELRAALLAIGDGSARPLRAAMDDSHEWGQPWLTAYWSYRRRERQRRLRTNLTTVGVTASAPTPQPS
jgi:hypothetical protein